MAHNIATIFDLAKQTNYEELSYQDQETSSVVDGSFLSILHNNGRLGAAYYNFREKTLNIYEEIPDMCPRYLASENLLREVSPKYLLTFGNTADEYVKALVEFFNAENDTTKPSNSLRLSENLFLIPLKEFTYEACKTIVSNIITALSQLDSSDIKQDLILHSFINLNHRLSLQALGGLYKYLEKNWSTFGVEPRDAHFLGINQVTMKNRVLLDNQSFKALQIFSPRSHDSGFKRGQESSCREGLSIFKLFFFGCKSSMGQAQLRNILLSPTNDRSELEKRLSFISFILDRSSADYVDNIQENIKQFRSVKHVSLILDKILNSRANNRDWNNLHKMIYHTIFINDLSHPYREKSELLVELNTTITENLLALREAIGNALDFNTGIQRGRPVIKFGLDEHLDAKLLRQRDIVKHVTAAAKFAVHNLPDFINECKVVYLPEMGHLMAIKEWEPDCDPETLQYLGYQYMFSLGGLIHYKNPLCVELDRRLGDINAEIIDHENRILRRLSAFILKYNKDIRDSIKVIALIDCLIAIAKVSQQNNYVKPELNNQRIYEVEKGRHPLMEQIFTTFETNDFYSGGPYSHIKVVTGANGSGKSIYLKQIVLIVYMAHIGCYVSAKRANIGLVHSLHCRMHNTESAVVRLSSFMMDIAQTSQALTYAASNSFIIFDEFGRGTLDEDGVILLVGLIKYFLEKQDLCPHILISTHLHKVATLLPDTDLLQYVKMDQVIKNGSICFLHKVSEGMDKLLSWAPAGFILRGDKHVLAIQGVSYSHTFEIAASILSQERLKKAKKYLKTLQQNKDITIE